MGDDGVVGTYSDQGVVLRTHKLGEADRIITLLTRDHGKVRAVAKGVRRTASRFGARLEPFSQLDLQLVSGRNLDIVSQAVSLRLFGRGLLDDYPRFTAAEAMVETADRLVAQEREPSRRHYLLLVGALNALVAGTADGPRPPTVVLDSYLLRALAVSGYAPMLDGCAACGQALGQGFFSPQAGGLVCARCRPPGATAVGPVTLAYLTALLTGRWPDTRDIPPAVRRQASSLVAAFASWHLEQRLRSLSHVVRD
jgi:DNA repair protein RecO (recombination protein O)